MMSKGGWGPNKIGTFHKILNKATKNQGIITHTHTHTHTPSYMYILDIKEAKSYRACQQDLFKQAGRPTMPQHIQKS